MATVKFPAFPPSLKSWTSRDRELNHFAIRSFRDVADADYIAARLAYRAQLPVQFLWASQQAFEKYLKFILFLERIKVEKLGHDLAPALKAIEDAGLVLALTKSTQQFIKAIDRTGRFVDESYRASRWEDSFAKGVDTPPNAEITFGAERARSSPQIAWS